MAADLELKWKTAKNLFETTTKVKKPSLKFMSTFKQSTGIVTTLRQADVLLETIPKTPKGAAELAKTSKAFSAAKRRYMKVLDDALGNEPEWVDRKTYYNGLRVLSTQLEALESTFRVALIGYRGAVEIRAEKASATDIAVRQLLPGLKSTSEKAAAFVARVRANPTPEAYNFDIQDAARDIQVGLSNINKFKGKGYTIDLTEPTNLVKVLRPWANGTRKVKPDATAEVVLKQVRIFEQTLEGVQRWLKESGG